MYKGGGVYRLPPGGEDGERGIISGLWSSERDRLKLWISNNSMPIGAGQSELKKLKRENDHLRREIWALRDEVDRLEALLKLKEQVSN